jgi:lipid-binding SYLF domain-containing protein
MFRLTCLRLAGLLLGAAMLASPAVAQQAQQTLVDRATLAVQEVLTTGEGNADSIGWLKRARAVIICPRVFRASFIFGGEGGACVLVARDGGGSWSSPAFYGLGSGSVGLQIGMQEATVMMMIMTDRALQAVMTNQFTLGADVSMTMATVGAGLQGGTTSAAGADIVTVARSRGLFAGLSLAGSVLTHRPQEAEAYYGRPFSAQQIVVRMEAHNPGADPLRAMLMRFGTP